MNSTISDDRIGVNVVKYDYDNDNNQSVDVSTVTVKMSGRIVEEMMCNVSIVPFDKGTFSAPLTSSTMANIIGNFFSHFFNVQCPIGNCDDNKICC